MTSQRLPLQPDKGQKLKPMMDAIYLIALLATGSGVSNAIIKGLGL